MVVIDKGWQWPQGCLLPTLTHCCVADKREEACELRRPFPMQIRYPAPKRLSAVVMTVVKAVVDPPARWNRECLHPFRLDRSRFAGVRLEWEDLELVERIGSDSRNGIVYRAHVCRGVHREPLDVAVKVMPRLYRDAVESEISIATALGRDAHLPVPLVFGSGYLEHFRLPTSFGQRFCAWEEASRRRALQQGATKARALRAAKTGKEQPDLVPAGFLISELAVGDLNQIGAVTKDIEAAAVRALHLLHEEARYTHGDVHLGNFLFTQDQGVLVHDFGAAQPFSQEEGRGDFRRLQEALAKRTSVSDE